MKKIKETNQTPGINPRKKVACITADKAVAGESGNCIEFMEKVCNDKGYDIIFAALLANRDCTVGRQTADAINRLLAGDLIDGVVSYSSEMFACREGKDLLKDIHDNGKFFFSYAEDKK